jgi:serine/threonine protein kinase
MGVVYEAEDTRLGRRVAVKFLPPEMAQDTQLIERFQREARAASALNHPNICTIHSIEQHERQHFLVMELLEGQTLAQLIGRQPFPTDRLLPMAIQIADALESVHAKGIDSILNREPRPADQVNPAVPAEFGRVLSKLLEKDRNLRCQTATELKTDLNRLKRDLDSGNKRAAEMTESKSGASKQAVKSVAVLYFENLSGVKEDEYLRDGITEDIITELSKIRGLNTFSRPTVLGPTATSW